MDVWKNKKTKSKRLRTAENVAIQRIIDLMKEARAPVYLVHTSTLESVQIIQKARSQGEPIHSETCTHHLVLTEDELKKEHRSMVAGSCENSTTSCLINAQPR